MDAIHYYSLDNKYLYELAKFVVEENYNHHAPSESMEFQDEVNLVYAEEEQLNNSKIFAAKNDNGSMVGSIRVLRWNLVDQLPTQKLFDINPLTIESNSNNAIYHIGRFAVKQGIDRSGFVVFKTLMTYAINEVCKYENSFALAECDAKLLKVVKLLGIQAHVISDSIYYLGSDTIPVLLPYKGLKKFLDKNKHLIMSKSDELHKSVVFDGSV